MHAEVTAIYESRECRRPGSRRVTHARQRNLVRGTQGSRHRDVIEALCATASDEERIEADPDDQADEREELDRHGHQHPIQRRHGPPPNRPASAWTAPRGLLLQQVPQGGTSDVVEPAALDVANALARALHDAGWIVEVRAIGELDIDVSRVRDERHREAANPDATHRTEAECEQPIRQVKLLVGIGHHLAHEISQGDEDLAHRWRSIPQERIHIGHQRASPVSSSWTRTSDTSPSSRIMTSAAKTAQPGSRWPPTVAPPASAKVA